MVVRGVIGDLVEQKEGWKAEEEFGAGDGDTDHRVGDECASAEFEAQYACAYRVWVYFDGGRGRAHHRNSIRVEG